jgi:formylmethanofuran dehydrogenase subunit E
MCKTHTKYDDLSKKTICKNCLVKCEKCGEFKDPSGFRTLGKHKVCEFCFRKEMQKKTLKNVFD